MTMYSKICSQCKELKPFNKFDKRKNRKIGIVSACKECEQRRHKKWSQSKRGRAYQKAYWKVNQRKITLQQAGLTIGQWNELFQQQNGCCAICGKTEQDIGRHLDIDHDHKTGKIRGLLCRTCNANLGLYENKQRKFTEYIVKKFKGYLK